MAENSELHQAFNELRIKSTQLRKAVEKYLNLEVKVFEHGKNRQMKERKYLRNSFDFLRKKWIYDVIYVIHLRKKPYYADLHKDLPEINPRSLSQRLDELQKLSIINRNIEPGNPVRIFYTLTEYGEGIFNLLIPLLIFIAHPEIFLE